MAKSQNIDQQVEVAKQQFTRLADTITEAMAQEMETWGKEVIIFANESEAMPVETGALRASGFAQITAGGANKNRKQVLTFDGKKYTEGLPDMEWKDGKVVG